MSEALKSTKGAFFWDYSGYSYSGLEITEYTKFNFQKNTHSFWGKQNTHGGGDLRTTTSSNRTPDNRAGDRVGFPAKNFPKERVFCLFQAGIFRANRIPFIMFILLSEANERNDIPFIPKTE